MMKRNGKRINRGIFFSDVVFIRLFTCIDVCCCCLDYRSRLWEPQGKATLCSYWGGPWWLPPPLPLPPTLLTPPSAAVPPLPLLHTPTTSLLAIPSHLTHTICLPCPLLLPTPTIYQYTQPIREIYPSVAPLLLLSLVLLPPFPVASPSSHRCPLVTSTPPLCPNPSPGT